MFGAWKDSHIKLQVRSTRLHQKPEVTTGSQERCPGTNKLFHTPESTFLFGFYSKLWRATEENPERLLVPRKPCRVYQCLQLTDLPPVEAEAQAALGRKRKGGWPCTAPLPAPQRLRTPRHLLYMAKPGCCCAFSLAPCSENLSHVPGAACSTASRVPRDRGLRLQPSGTP